MEMDEKMKAVICMELDILKQKVEMGLVSRFNLNTDRMFASDGTKMTCTVINFMEEPAVIEDTHTTLDEEPNRAEGIFENEIPPSALNKDLSTFRGVSSETICSQKYDVRNLPPFLACLAADPNNTKLLEAVLGRGLKGLGKDQGSVFFVTRNADDNPTVETLVAPKSFVNDLRTSSLRDLSENGAEYTASFPVSVFADMNLPADMVVAVKNGTPTVLRGNGKIPPVEDPKPAFPTDLINDVTEF